MKKFLKVLLIIFLSLLVICIAFGIWQRENILALWKAMQYSQNDISTLLVDNEKIISDALAEYGEIDISDVDDREIQALEEGKITQEDLVEIVLGKTSLEEAIEKHKDEENSGSHENAPENPAPPENGDEQVARLVAKMYTLKGSYIGKIDALVGQAKAEYTALPKDKRTAAAKQKILSAKIGSASALEAACDGQVEAILSELTTVLESQGKDLSLVSSIRKAYANEKQLRKSYYISKYLN